MTVNDWIGLTATVITFLLMAVLYRYVLKGENREKLEAHRFIIMDDDSSGREEVKNG